MGTVLKKNWPLLALFVAVGVILTLLMALDRAQDEAIASMMADKSMAQVRARDAAIVAKYAPQLAAKDAAIVALNSAVVAKSVEVKAWRARSEAAQAAGEDKDRLLDECQAKVEELDACYTEKLSDCDRIWGEKYALKVQESQERIDALTNRLGQVTKSAYQAALANRKKLIIGPQVHYGTGGLSVGFGATWELWRFKAPGQ